MMTQYPLRKRAIAEFTGTAFLAAAVVGSGIMAESLAGGNVAVALLANTIATGSALLTPILTFGAISGAHFNPAVTLADAIESRLPARSFDVHRCPMLRRDHGNQSSLNSRTSRSQKSCGTSARTLAMR